MRRLAIALALTPLAVPVAAQTPAAATIPGTDLATAARRGALIYEYDQAAWHTTDAMLATKLPQETMRTIRGWVVEPAGTALRVTYYGMAGATPFAIYIADYAGKAVRGGHAASPAERNLTPFGSKAAAARDAATALAPRGCVDRPFNAVVLPPEADGRIPVYLLTPMLEAGAFPAGGHHEVDVGSDARVLGTRAFTRTCLTLRPSPPRGGATVGMFVSHLLDPHPTEIHVYLSLWSGVPVYVGAGGGVWQVSGTAIHPVEVKK